MYDFAREKWEAGQDRNPEFDGPTKDEIEADMIDPDEDETDIEDEFIMPKIKRTSHTNKKASICPALPL